MIFRKKCTYCNRDLEKGSGVKAEVKVPELKSPVFRPFCNEDCWKDYKENVKGTPRTSYCPSCPI